MSRTAIYQALSLRNRLSGESNTDVYFLTAEQGIIRATVFGGPKSKLRSHSAPYNSGRIWIYHDPAKDYMKLSDFDVQLWRPGLRELYERSMAAAAVSETILSSHGGGGDWVKALSLSTTALDALETANDELCPHIFIHFLWNWLDFLGIQPDLKNCTFCDASDNTPYWYSHRENHLLCDNCVPRSELCPQGSSQSQALSPQNAPKNELCPQGSSQNQALSTQIVPKAELCPQGRSQNQALSPQDVPKTGLCPQEHSQSQALSPQNAPKSELCPQGCSQTQALSPQTVPKTELCPQEHSQSQVLSPQTVPKTELCPQGCSQSQALSPQNVPKTELCPQGRSQNQALSPRGFSKIGTGSRRWLLTVEKIEPSNLYRYSLDRKSFEEVKSLVTEIMAEVIGKKLTSWEW